MSTSIVVGMGFGDEGKGTVVDYLASRATTKPLVVRFSGGAQAAHNVIDEHGVHHTFSQFGSATLRGSSTLLSRYCLVDPLRLFAESLHLNELLSRRSLELVAIDERAPLVTRIHQLANHNLERARGEERHGSTGLGMGMTELYRLQHEHSYPTVGDLNRPQVLSEKLKRLYEWATELSGELSLSLEDVERELLAFAEDGHLQLLTPRETRSALWSADHLLFEGSQGALLDEWYGFHPHTTWSTVTPHNAFSLLREAGLPALAEIVGVTRTYTTRHGAGPFPSENNALGFTELHNAYGEFQGGWRIGALDTTLLNYAASIVRPTTLAVTHMDVEQTHVTARYDELFDFASNVKHSEDKQWQESFTRKLESHRPELVPVTSSGELLRLIEGAAGAQAKILSYGPQSDQKRER